VKRPGREADHSPPASAEVKKNVNLYIHSPICIHGIVLIGDLIFVSADRVRLIFQALFVICIRELVYTYLEEIIATQEVLLLLQ
jgi:hypothetical protein